MKHTILKNRPRGFRATGVVLNDNKILLMKQIYNGNEFYNLPGGAWEFGETLEDTCKREVKEEFNIDVAVRRLIYILDSEPRINFVFECKYLGGKIELGGPEKERMDKNEQYHVEWVDINSIKTINLQPTPTKKCLLKYLANQGSPTFFHSTVNDLNNTVLIISSDSNSTPPRGYGGIERVTYNAYNFYKRLGYKVDMVSKPDSKIHDFSHNEIKNIDLNRYRFILCYYYNQEIVEYLDKQDPVLYIILQNNYSTKLQYLKNLKYAIPGVLSEDQKQQYFQNLGINYDITPNGVDTHTFKLLNLTRDKDIAYIGILGQHKSPLACLRYAKKYGLSIDFYGPLGFRDDEKEYEKYFLQEAKQYRKAKIYKEINDKEKLQVLNTYKYFTFLPSIDKKEWIEPFGIAPLEAMACGCTVITQLEKGGHKSFCTKHNTIDYKNKPHRLKPKSVRESILNYDYQKVFKSYYPI